MKTKIKNSNVIEDRANGLYYVWLQPTKKVDGRHAKVGYTMCVCANPMILVDYDTKDNAIGVEILNINGSPAAKTLKPRKASWHLVLGEPLPR